MKQVNQRFVMSMPITWHWILETAGQFQATSGPIFVMIIGCGDNATELQSPASVPAPIRNGRGQKELPAKPDQGRIIGSTSFPENTHFQILRPGLIQFRQLRFHRHRYYAHTS